MSRAAVLLTLGLLALSGCSGSSDSGAVGPSGTAAESRDTLQTQIACRDRVNEMYERRDRAEIFQPGSTVNTPFSSNFNSGVTSRGLANQFDYERTRAECERNSGPEEAPSIQAPAPAPPAPRVR